MNKEVPGVDIAQLFCKALEEAREAAKNGELALGDTLTIELDIPTDDYVMRELDRIFGINIKNGIQVMYIDQNYKILNLSVVKEPSVIIMLDGIAIMELVGLFDKNFETMTGETIEDSDLNTGFAFLEEIFSQHETEGRFMLVSNLVTIQLSSQRPI